MVLYLQPQKQQRVCFLETFTGILKDCFWQKKKTEKNKAKHCVIKKSILHLQPEKHQGVQGESSCKKTVFEVEKMF